ncbi:unnamed protein product [Caenorhabditis angaria]|uniref:Uncharacterized protein n=1 Tax=Caenorhabditis angaria TaxID=860376 RepID=A0A9P1IUQ9_9PELO|nr:unnamed protein product [Caenorhabditis angaria]
MSIFNCVYCGTFGISVGLFAVQFIYRFLVLSGNPLLKTFNSWKIVLWLSILIFLGLLWGAIPWFFGKMTDKKSEYIRYYLLKTMDVNVDEIVYNGPYFYAQKADGTFDIDMESLIAIVVMYGFLFTFDNYFA